MLKCFNMKDCALKSIFMKKKIQLDIDNLNIDKLFCKTDKEYYQQAVGSLLYLLLDTRLDIVFVVIILS